MRGVPRSGLWSEEEIASSGTGSERAQGRERSRGDPSASQGPRDPALAAGRTTGAHAAGEEEFLGTSLFLYDGNMSTRRYFATTSKGLETVLSEEI
ncbi:MAG TPA: hypothetical protein VJ307_09570, partial [Candidatus Deferrimicrobiaceae bacterium]|nr:hypothetical protein [Candidatus Deferrimicrobiaceae bacterium]